MGNYVQNYGGEFEINCYYQFHSRACANPGGIQTQENPTSASPQQCSKDEEITMVRDILVLLEERKLCCSLGEVCLVPHFKRAFYAVFTRNM